MQVEGIGHFDHWGEFWRLVYDGCGHATQLLREMGYDNWDYTAKVIREHYAECSQCRYEREDRARESRRKRVEYGVDVQPVSFRRADRYLSAVPPPTASR